MLSRPNQQGSAIIAKVPSKWRIEAASFVAFLLEREAAALMAHHGSESGVGRDVEKAMDACRLFSTANVNWSLVTERYGIGGSAQALRRRDRNRNLT